MALITAKTALDWHQKGLVGQLEHVSEHRFSGNPALNDCLVLFAQPFHGYRVMPLWVAMEQCDTNGTPTLQWGFGYINGTDDGIDAGSGSVWASAIATLGRGANVTMWHAHEGTGNWLRVRGYGRNVGLHYSAAAATAAFANKRVWAGMRVAPI